MFLMHDLPIDKHSIRLGKKARKKQRPLMLNHDIVGLCVELVSSGPLKIEVSAK